MIKIHWLMFAFNTLWAVQDSDSKVIPIQQVTNLTDAPFVTETVNASDVIHVGNKMKCKLSPTNTNIRDVIAKAESAKLFEYELKFTNYTVNPLLVQSIRENYKANIWQKASTKHGRALVTLSFNFDVLSLSMLSLGVEKHTVILKDEPIGCFGELSEMNRMDSVLWLLSRDFNPESAFPTIAKDDYICHQVFHTSRLTARFVDKCCTVDIHRNMTCDIEFRSVTLDVLIYLVMALKIVVFLLTPWFIPRAAYMFSRGADTFRVKLKSSLQKTILVASKPGKVKFDQHWPAEALDTFDEFQKNAKALPKGKPVKVTFNEYCLSVATDHVLTENHVPVGPFPWMNYKLLKCGIRKFWACADCCNASICGKLRSSFPIKWKHIGYAVSGLILVTLIIPFPYWIRLIFFYVFEREELSNRSEFANKFGFNHAYELHVHIVQYFFPNSAPFIVCYVMYAILILLHICFMIEPSGTYRKIVKSSFVDMHTIPISTIVGKMVKFLLKPCRFLGCFGIFIGVIFWSIAVPICLVCFIVSCAPMFYLSFRFFVHICTAVSHTYSKIPNAEEMVSDQTPTNQTMNCCRKILCFILPVIYLIGIWTTMLLVSECFGFGLEVVIFTVIGLIVNAGSVLRYLSILFLLFVYSYDCFHNVYLKYLSLNKAIFKDVFERVKDDVTEVTKLPSRLQENRGFKSEVITEQGDHEEPDNFSSERQMHWNVNDLVLFVTKFDLHYLPVKLFYAITMIEVAGSPGPVYKSMFHAWRRFGQIVIFLGFLVMAVNIFGSIYKVGSMSQTLATLAGGIFPFILRNFVSSEAKPIELSSITFRRKVDEVIAHFKEDWPISDLPFEIDGEVESCERVDIFIELPKSGSKKQILINMGWRDKPCTRDDQSEDDTIRESRV